MSCEEKSKTIAQLRKEFDEHLETFRRGASGDQKAYAKARDERDYFAVSKWVPLEEAQKLEAQLNRIQHWIEQEIAVNKNYVQEYEMGMHKDRKGYGQSKVALELLECLRMETSENENRK